MRNLNGRGMQGIDDLYQRSHSFPLDEHICTVLDPPALPGGTLKFIGSIVQAYKPVCVVEFGSGLSTQFLASALRTHSPEAHLYTVEHSRYYLEKAEEAVHGCQNVTILHSPIRLYRFRWKTFATYDPAWTKHLPCPTRVDLVLVDGPPARRFGREAPLYQVAPFITPETLILLDDASREPEQDAIASWRRVFVDGIEVELFPEPGKGFAVIRLRSPARMARSPFGIREIMTHWRKAKTVWRTEAQ